MESTQVAPVDTLVSGIEMILFFASSIIFAVSGHVIGRKLGHSSPWLAWVPMVSVFYFASLGRVSRTVMVMYFIPILNLYAWGTTFASISGRLSLPNWLGYCILLPVVNVFTMAYMAGSGKAVASRESTFAKHAMDEHLRTHA